MNLQSIREGVSAAQQEAQRTWRVEVKRPERLKGMLFSRGRYIAVEIVQPNGRIENVYPGEEREWDGTLRDLEAAIAEAKRRKPGRVEEVSIFGGFDYAESPVAYRTHNEYDPLVAEWDYKVIYSPANV